MDRRRFLTFIIIWFVVILVWLLFCYGEVRDAYYSWDEIAQSFLVTNISSEVVETTEKEPEKLTDYSKKTDYAKNAVYKVRDAGIINGYADGTFAPNASLTRAEAATVIIKLLDMLQ